MGGSVASGGAGVAPGVGGAETDGTGGIVGEVGCAGGAVGAAAGGGVGGVAVRASVAVGGVAAGPERICGAVDPLLEGAEGDPVAGAGDSLGVACPLESRVRLLNPARATPIASDGPRSTYRVKEARPAWPRARPPDFPSYPTLVGSSYLPAIRDK
jgi:hypothetical protein